MSRKRTILAAGQAVGRGERGFTPIELMIALAMFAIVSLAGFTVLSSGQQSSVMNDEVVKIQQNVRLAVDL
ncbi:MAG: prepilin-type N-terminal cleavage/methylation domain-containing protein, partial [Nitrospiraceae bacterium]